MTGVFDLLGSEGFGTYQVDLEAGSFERVSRPSQGLLVPGFVDLHIHGGYGIDFMTADSDGIWSICDAFSRDGYETLLATTVTAGPEDVLRMVEALPDHPLIAGFHLEGPFISPRYPGAQPQSAIAEVPCIVDGNPMGPWREVLAHPRLRYITMAPELPGALDLILWLKSRGVIVSMGHTNATFAEARAGFGFGATHATHVFNAMRPFHHREPGAVGYVLTQRGVQAELIYDRIHVHPDAASLLVQCKGTAGITAVSDGTRAIGQQPGSTFSMWGLECVVGPGEVRLRDGTLAGSTITLLDAFRNLYTDFGPELAIHACSLNPRRALGMNQNPSRWILLDRELRLVEVFAATASA